MSLNPAKVYTEPNGYKYVETADWWKDVCSVLPCFAAIHWPNYSTAVVEDTINGKPVVIQLWKGLIPQLVDETLGGIGGEVGIYERIPGRKFPTSKPDSVPSPLWEFLVNTIKIKKVADLWWPVPEKNEVEFDFINPVNNTVVFHAGPQKTYWRNKWMDPDSFAQYEKTQGKKHGWLPAWFPWNSRTPKFAAQYTMEYRINGKTYPRW